MIHYTKLFDAHFSITNTHCPPMNSRWWRRGPSTSFNSLRCSSPYAELFLSGARIPALENVQFYRCNFEGAHFTGPLNNVTFKNCLMSDVDWDDYAPPNAALTNCITSSRPLARLTCALCLTDLNTDTGHTQYCDECWYTSYCRCERCGDRINRGALCGCGGAAVTDVTPTPTYLNTAIGFQVGRVAPRTGIHDYSYKPTPNFHSAKGETQDDSTLNFGLEMECEGPEDSTDDSLNERASVLHKTPLLYVKHDGSLDHGFEIVTHPFTWNWWKTEAPGVLRPVLKALVKEGFRSGDTKTCGLHIHMSRGAFGESSIPEIREPVRLDDNTVISRTSRWGQTGSPHLCRFLTFMEKNQPFMSFLSRRTLDKLQEYAALGTYRSPAAACKSGYWTSNRRAAVNLQNHHTVEVRLFRGSISWAGVSTRIELCHALWMFTKITSHGLLDYTDFIEFLANPHYDGAFHRGRGTFSGGVFTPQQQFDLLTAHAKRSKKKEYVHPVYPNLYSFLVFNAKKVEEVVTCPK